MNKFFRIVAILSMVMGVNTVHGASTEADKGPTAPTSSGSSTVVFFDKKDMVCTVRLYGPNLDGRKLPAWSLRSRDVLVEQIQKTYNKYVNIDRVAIGDIGLIMHGAGEVISTASVLSSLYERARSLEESSRDLIDLNVTMTAHLFKADLPGPEPIFFDRQDVRDSIVIDGPGLKYRLPGPAWILRSREAFNTLIVDSYKMSVGKIALEDIGSIKTNTGEEIGPDTDLTPLYVRARSEEIIFNLTIASHVFGAKL